MDAGEGADPYVTLGVARDATEAEITRALPSNTCALACGARAVA